MAPELSLLMLWTAWQGLEARINALLKSARSKDERRALIQAAGRLVEVPGMGSAYKVFALAHPDIPERSVPGFPGPIPEEDVLEKRKDEE